ncbi:MAG TPA: prephenate dehydrogenase/arogenate dehydrogenase family protein [Acidimicrobiales bacterium]|nr:prephenate dehydrogenase/arogenate dehydrogenase family protein [Acidimicrobiales bacterium]
MTSPARRRAHVVGLGLIGASIARALGEAGWDVTGADLDDTVTQNALASSVVVPGALDEDVTLVVVATPAGAVAAAARSVLESNVNPDLIVTDVAGVKSSIVAEVGDARFLGGHPMAGSEQRGLAGARADLFRGCTWVLTPTPSTSARAYSTLHGILRDIGATVVAIDAEDHDRLVALASHVPHLVAGALMNEAARAAEEDAVLLQLAAGGFRDMTRVAAGDPTIWPDVLFENRSAVSKALESLEMRLGTLRRALDEGEREVVETSLRTAAQSRRHLPGRALSADNLAYLRVVVSDQPGQLSAVTTAASEMSVNIYDIEIAHGIEGAGGTLLLAVDAHQADTFRDALSALGFTAARE